MSTGVDFRHLPTSYRRLCLVVFSALTFLLAPLAHTSCLVVVIQVLLEAGITALGCKLLVAQFAQSSSPLTPWAAQQQELNALYMVHTL